MLDTVKQKFKGTSWFIAPASSHYYNGQVEGNLCVLKGLLTGHLKIMNMKNYVFRSMISIFKGKLYHEYKTTILF